MTYRRFTLDNSTPPLWRVTFDHPAINLIDSVMIGELGQLFAAVDRPRWTRSGKQWRGQRCRREPAKRSTTACNNAAMSNYASASTWDSSPRTLNHCIRNPTTQPGRPT